MADKQDTFESAIATGGTVAEFADERRGFLGHIQHTLHRFPTLVPLIILMIGVGGFAIVAGERFFTPFNMSLIIQQVTIIGILAAAQTLVILTAGIDLSVAAMMMLSSVVMGRLAVESGVPVIPAIMIGMIVGMGCGLINGFLVTRLRLPPFIVTLGTWSIFYALNLWYSGSATVRSQDIDAEAPLLKFFGERTSFSDIAVGLRLDQMFPEWQEFITAKGTFFSTPFTYGSILLIVVFIFLWYLLNRTAWGRHVYAVGDDKEAAELAGIRTDRVLLSVYGLAGLICGLGAWAAVGRVGSISPLNFYEGNLDSITAVVVGGCSLFGGRGAIIGTLIGAITVGIFRNGLKLAGVDVLWQEFTVGVLIIVAVAIDQWIREVSK